MRLETLGDSSAPNLIETYEGARSFFARRGCSAHMHSLPPAVHLVGVSLMFLCINDDETAQ
jgi:hypothetical protein